MSRTLANVLGVIGAGMVGYQRGADQKADRERRDEEADYNRRQRERTEREQARLDEIRTSMAETYAPTTVQAEPPKPETMDNRDVGQPGEQPVGGFVAGGRQVDGYQEGGQRFASQPEAEKFAAAYNTPTARTLRMAEVLGSRGEVQAAQNMRTSARQEKVADMQLNEAEAAHVNKLFDQGLEPLQTPDALANYVSSSTIGGELKVQAVPSADGKTFSFLKVNPDGSTAPGSRAYPNSPEGLMQAKVEMSKALPVSQKLDFLFKSRTNEAEVKLKTSQAGYYDKLGDAATTKADKTGASAYDRMSEVDKVTLTSLNKRAGDIEGKIIEAQATNMWEPDSPNAKALQTQLAAVRMQASALLRKYSDEPAADPVGIRTPPAAAPSSAKTTRPATSMETVMQDLAKPGAPKRARIQLSGQPAIEIGADPAPAAGAPAAKPAASKGSTFTPDPAMEERLQRETTEMNAVKGTRLAYSNEVTEYLKKKRAAATDDINARGEEDRADELRRSKERAKAYGI